MSNRRKGFVSRNNSKGFYNQPFRMRNEQDRKKSGILMDIAGGGGGSSFKHQGRYDPQSNRFDPVYRGRNNRKRGGRHRMNDPRSHGASIRQDLGPLWFKVTVPFGKKLQKDILLKSLMSCSQTAFTPINFHLNGNAVVFYVDNRADSDALRQCSRRLTAPDGAKIQIHISNSPPPNTTMNEENTQKVKVAMSNCFDLNTFTLDLHSFHLNQELRSQGLYVPLSRVNVLEAVVKIIASNIPQMRSLNLSNNRLASLTGTKDLLTDCKDLKSLNLKSNMINSINDLNALKGCKIDELILDGNPLCDHYKDKDTYISDVRSKFPRVIKLDGQDLPPPILFDLGTTETLPKIKGSFFPTPDLAQNVLHFLEIYFGVYDSDNRQGLLDAYHEEAVYSLQVAKPPGRPQDYKLLSEYIEHQGNRNLFKVDDPDKRERLLRKGKVAIVSQLCNLPKTQHFPNSITVDVSHLSTSLLMFTVSGLFKEVDSNLNVVKAFSRNFLVVPHDQGILIINEMHLVTSPTGAQVKAHRDASNSAANAHATVAPVAPSEIPVVIPEAVPLLGPPSTVGGLTEDDKKNLVMQMVNFSRMNVGYSTKCLEEQNWDLNSAMQIFTELNNRGAIPADAFQPL